MSEWIRVSDGLPSFGKTVLACWRFADGKPEMAVTRYEGEWLNPDNEDDQFAEPDYWMELPASPFAAVDQSTKE